MKLREAEIPGVWTIEVEPFVDARGSFARTFDAEAFAAHGIDARIAQCDLSRNPQRGTLRGLHHQITPRADARVVRCVRGRIFDVLVDLRPESPTFRRWTATVLDAERDLAVFVPPGIAHGFQTLVDESDVFYQHSESYAPELQRGVRWDDPAFAIRWPLAPSAISARDRSFPDFA